ncbi:Acetyl esterase/lipase [Rhizobium sp. NFR07]|uniref:alpha/beta hydrolase fold domain-containing protein n=1 Tax=Rhizobium sp. NFR07 TaxID=1566262 RepID=UPI0008E1FF82|nr:alpha/beta hydrolase [Rhizobium sp. NFR07]SFB43656.1 Acetyl esterase/lipase [Rhizobium sp. NFR07]
MALRWETLEIDGPWKAAIPVRIHRAHVQDAKPPVVLYLKGDAFQDPGQGVTQSPVVQAFEDAGAVVVEADYGRVSQNVFPKAMECAFMALYGLNAKLKQFGSGKSLLLIAGDEAGGNVAAGAALKARDQMPGQLAGQVLLSPMIDPLMTSASIRRADEIGMREKWSDGWSRYLGTACVMQHPYAAPCLCSRLSGLAPALVVTSEDDPLRDEVVGYANRLRESGVAVRQRIFSAECGWTDVYRQGVGRWLPSLCSEFREFVAGLRL